MSEILNILGSVGFNWHVALANFVNFLIILFLLNKFFFGKLGKVITQRQEVIERGLSHASDAEKALREADNEKKAILANAHNEGLKLVDSAKDHAVALASSIVKEAETEANRKMALLKEKEEKLGDDVEKMFSLAAPEIVARLFAKTLQKEMSAAENDALIARIKA